MIQKIGQIIDELTMLIQDAERDSQVWFDLVETRRTVIDFYMKYKNNETPT